MNEEFVVRQAIYQMLSEIEEVELTMSNNDRESDLFFQKPIYWYLPKCIDTWGYIDYDISAGILVLIKPTFFDNPAILEGRLIKKISDPKVFEEFKLAIQACIDELSR